jgi:microfibrillar-associated protein 1
MEDSREEIERRRAMPEAQRLAEDTERAERSRDEKRREREAAGNSGGNFMQKYHHKGSFFQDMDILKNRDYSARTESTVDVSLLPKVMQVRDYGKAGRSKWTHLSNEDTSRKQQDHRMKGISGTDGSQSASTNGQQCFTCGGPHLRRDCPQSHKGGGGGGEARSSREGRGPNNIPLRERDYRPRDRRSHSPERRREHSSSARRER